MHKLLLPVDGSDNALCAVRYAIHLANENGPVSIHLVTAHEPPDLYGKIAVYVTQEKMEQLQREHSEALLKEAERLLVEGGVPYTKETNGLDDNNKLKRKFTLLMWKHSILQPA